ncbi:MAG: hypothetical protein JW966_09420, partial [Anaerolineae bacterium]|nr:hypothetical protein [Anaerolineae bacterium]
TYWHGFHGVLNSYQTPNPLSQKMWVMHSFPKGRGARANKQEVYLLGSAINYDDTRNSRE